MFAHGHHSMMGSIEDPADGGKVAVAVFGAVGVYGVSCSREQELAAIRLLRWARADAWSIKVFLLFCGSQAWMNARQSRQGEIALR